VILAHRVAELEILGTVDIEELRSHPDHEKLSDFFFQREPAEGLLRPFFAVAVEMDRTGVLIFFFSQAGHTEGEKHEEDRQGSDHGRTIARSSTGVRRSAAVTAGRMPALLGQY